MAKQQSPQVPKADSVDNYITPPTTQGDGATESVVEHREEQKPRPQEQEYREVEVTPELPAENAAGTPVPEDQPRPQGLLFFAQTNSWRINHHGERVDATELMGGFVYRMQQAGRLADTEANYRRDFESFLNS